ncbi:MAG: PQQ-binding-like beta-propeller repeat protein [Phycisphaerae bacterium]|nr:PQQ-binding-like beta-propeller repeat protein [Phycisphaerae bacterium]
MRTLRAKTAVVVFLLISVATANAENWLQFKYDSRHSGNAADRSVASGLGLIGAVPLTDAVFTAPVVADGRVYVVDGSGVAFCIDASTLRVLWKSDTAGDKTNCNNVSSPAIAGRYLHFGTMAGYYYVLDKTSGDVVKRISCGEPILSAPVVTDGRVYFATLGSQVYAVEPGGAIRWAWDFVKEVLKFSGDRWSGEQWCKHKGGKVTWRDQFCCARDIAAFGKMIVIPAGGSLICLDDRGNRAELRGSAAVPAYAGSEKPAIFGLSIADDGAAYVQWHRRDNTGRVEIMQLDASQGKAEYVGGTLTEINRPGLLSFCSVSVRGRDVYRCRPEEGFGFCKHSPSREQAQYLGGYPSIASPILLRDKGVYGGLDGSLYIVPLSGEGKVWSFKTAFGKAISAPVAVCDGRVYFGCEDGYLYVLGPEGKAPLPSGDLQTQKIRSPLTGKLADSKYDWFTNFGNQASTNSNDQGLRPPFKINWIRRYKGTFKHMPVCGGGRMYTHTSEGQIFAVEQETGRLLWRRYWPGVHVSFTGPLYYKERLLVPQAGLKESRVRCLDAASGKLLWEAPFTGSPSWSRQQPPVVHKNLAVYAFGSGLYAPQGTEKAYVHKGKPVQAPDGTEIMSWIYSHNNPYYPADNKPLIRAWDIETGQEVWTIDFSQFGSGGNDAGVCLMDGTLYYSTFFGYAPARKDGQPKARGLTAAIEPATGQVIWLTTKYYVTAGCTVSADNGRLYLGGYNPPTEQTENRHVYCLDAESGSLLWRSDPVGKAVNVVTIGWDSVFVHGSTGQPSHVIDKDTGKLRSTFDKKYACTRFSLSEPYILGPNMDMIDISAGNKMVSSGPCIDARECVGAVVSNGRVFYTSQANGLQVSQVYGQEAE